MKYETRVTRLTVAPEGDAIFSEKATHIEIEDEAAGEFITIKQVNDCIERGEIQISPEEWPTLKAAIETILNEIRP